MTGGRESDGDEYARYGIGSMHSEDGRRLTSYEQRQLRRRAVDTNSDPLFSQTD
jgi:hypothetical protein